ncbi:143aa long hypothetical protein [Pyrococcus horikoshii OT3]|uniref:Uncharacterized protein n=1 Tax=Pyrococcus horikoshii (strain ATCC 700860 / DSM 12428 / JCM 9974 / NBRC 100139 / OT-3) TaxID=70601 RepID=O58823_PYRHO|nr:143aa long hypothetical protein [Pyrococcus horikoshii OT3]
MSLYIIFPTNIGTSLAFATSFASSLTFTLKPRITPYFGFSSFTLRASITSVLLMFPTSAFLIGISFSWSSLLNASRLPRVSAFTITPTLSVLMTTLSICLIISSFALSTSSGVGAAITGEPARASSSPGAAIFTPAAAVTSST